MRVTQLDAVSLENDIYQQIWDDVNKNFLPVKYYEEWELFIKSLVFLASTKKTPSGTITYGSSLTGNYYTSSRLALYIVQILIQYLSRKLSSAAINLQILSIDKLYKFVNKCITIWDFTTLLQLISGKRRGYLSIWHKLLDIQSLQSSNSEFYRNTVYSGIEFLNRQLLWNTLLEVLNVDIIASLLVKASRKRPSRRIKPKTTKQLCTYCNEVPTNPYLTTCCNSIYCYVCVLTSLERNTCYGCDTQEKFTATPLYRLTLTNNQTIK